MVLKQILFKKHIYILLLITSSVFSQLKLNFDPGPWNGNSWAQYNAIIENNTQKMWTVHGLRVTANEGTNWGLGNASPTTLTKIEDGSEANRYDIFISSYLRTLDPSESVAIEFRGNPEGSDWTVSDGQFLIKTGTCAEKVIYKVDPTYTVDQIDELISNDSFYNESLPFIDTLGMFGGDMSGGFIETFNGMTQIQVALPTTPFYQNNSWITFEPQEYGNAMYMMALAMGQEYLNVDMQMMIGCGGSENFGGMVLWNALGDGSFGEKLGTLLYGSGPNGQTTVDFSPFAVELGSFEPNIFNAYPKWFPIRSTKPNGSNNADYFSTSASGYCDLDKANIVNGTMIGCLFYWFVYDLAINAVEYCVPELIKNGKDRYAMVKLMKWAFNRGINDGHVQAFDDETALALDDILDHPDFYNVPKEYCIKAFVCIDALIKASKNSVTNGGTEPIYDQTISKDLLEEFFFGISGDGTTGQRGEGGLLQHFDLDDSKRIALWDDVTAAFEKLKGKAPSASGDSISYRYDFLTILRVAKAHLDLVRDIPTNDAYNNWMKVHTTTGILCSREPVDTTYPGMVVTDNGYNGNLYELTVNLKDAVELDIVDWTLDNDWKKWNKASKNSGDTLEASYLISIPLSEIHSQHSVGDTANLWIRGSDYCGNSLVEKRHFVVNETGINKVNKKSLKNSLSPIVIDKTIILDLSKVSTNNLNISILDAKGRVIKKVLPKRIMRNKLFINHSALASGVYILSIKSSYEVVNFKVSLK